MKKTIIISGGEKGGIEYAIKYKASEYEDTCIIACDKGLAYAKEEGIKPDLIIGDFDSYESALPTDIPIERLPVEKDDTDTMHAIREAVEKGSDLIIVCCALGGRLDHLMSNIQAARYAAERDVKIIVVGKATILHIIHNDEIILEKYPQYSLSVLALSDEAEISVRGTKYEVEREMISADFPLGQSNEWREDTAVIKVWSGTVMVMNCLLND